MVKYIEVYAYSCESWNLWSLIFSMCCFYVLCSSTITPRKLNSLTLSISTLFIWIFKTGITLGCLGSTIHLDLFTFRLRQFNDSHSYILANSLLILRWIFSRSLQSPKSSRVDTSVSSSAYMTRLNTDPEDIWCFINML